MINEIVERNLNKIEKDLSEINGLKDIDFIDIFPTSEDHKLRLDEEIGKIGKVICKTENTLVYFLKPLASEVYGKDVK